jgi:FixJ family two-component response regulator
MQRQLTVKQENVIDMLVVGANDSEVAQAVGVNRVTVSRWRLYSPQFQASPYGTHHSRPPELHRG